MRGPLKDVISLSNLKREEWWMIRRHLKSFLQITLGNLCLKMFAQMSTPFIRRQIISPH